jgi:hypothetical protein
MLNRLGVFLAVCLVAGPALGADEAEKVVDRAIRAHGGLDALNKVSHAVRSMTGTLTFNGQEMNFSQDVTLDLPERYRLEMELGAEKRKLLVIVAGDKGWRVVGGSTQEMTPDFLNEAREEGHVVYLSSLVPLRRDRGVTLKLLPEGKVQGKPADVVQVSFKDRADAQLFFDRDSGMLVKISRKTAIGGLRAERDYTFGEFRDFSGVRLPTRWQEFINGMKQLDGKVSYYKFQSRADDRQFAKP